MSAPPFSAGGRNTTMEKSENKKIKARVHPGSSKRTVQLKDDVYHIYTHARPVDGKANSEAVALLADYMGVPKRSVTIIRGEKSKSKVFAVARKV